MNPRPVIHAIPAAFTCFNIKLGCRPCPQLHTHRFHEFFLCVAGRGTQHVEQRVEEMRDGDLHFFPAGQAHIGAGAHDAEMEGYVLNMPTAIFSATLDGDVDCCKMMAILSDRAWAGHNAVPLRAATARHCRDLFMRMEKEMCDKKRGYRCALRALVQEFLLALIRGARLGALHKAFAKTHNSERIDEILRFLDAHYMEPVAIRQVARMANMSRSHFHAVFQRETGRTLVQHMNMVRTRAAENLLRASDIPIIQVAESCGFPSLSHFYAVFKRETGQTPRQVRQARG